MTRAASQVLHARSDEDRPFNSERPVYLVGNAESRCSTFNSLRRPACHRRSYRMSLTRKCRQRRLLLDNQRCTDGQDTNDRSVEPALRSIWEIPIATESNCSIAVCSTTWLDLAQKT